MIPGWGPSCDLCTPDVHYLLTCPQGHEWDEPPCAGDYACPECYAVVSVSWDAWEREVLGLA